MTFEDVLHNRTGFAHWSLPVTLRPVSLEARVDDDARQRWLGGETTLPIPADQPASRR
jgi:hypothetical protein